MLSGDAEPSRHSQPARISSRCLAEAWPQSRLHHMDATISNDCEILQAVNAPDWRSLLHGVGFIALFLADSSECDWTGYGFLNISPKLRDKILE